MDGNAPLGAQAFRRKAAQRAGFVPHALTPNSAPFRPVGGGKAEWGQSRKEGSSMHCCVIVVTSKVRFRERALKRESGEKPGLPRSGKGNERCRIHWPDAAGKWQSVGSPEVRRPAWEQPPRLIFCFALEGRAGVHERPAFDISIACEVCSCGCVTEKPYCIETRDRWLVAAFAEPWAVNSWAIVNGGWQHVRNVAWLYLQQNEIAAVDDAADWMRARMHAAGLAGAVGFMTSRRVLAWVETSAVEQGCCAWAVATVGLSNRLRAGDSSSAVQHGGTINLLVATSCPLTVEASLEALALVSEAKAVAVLESGERSVESRLAATGTGTDCLAVAWPVAGERSPYAGKHTAAGSAIGRAAYLAVSQGIREWRKEQQPE